MLKQRQRKARGAETERGSNAADPWAAVGVCDGGRQRGDLISNLMKSVNSGCVCFVCFCLEHRVTLAHVFIFRGKSEAALSFLLPLLVCCAILHQWCEELDPRYCLLPLSFPIPESRPTDSPHQLYWDCPATPPHAFVRVFEWMCRWLEWCCCVYIIT